MDSSRICQLENLKLKFENPPQLMTGKSICAILRQNPTLVDFENFSNFKFSNEDRKSLTLIAKERNLKILEVFESIECLFTCDNGEHAYF